MKTIMLLGFAVVIVGCFAGELAVVVIGAAAQTIGTLGYLSEARK